MSNLSIEFVNTKSDLMTVKVNGYYLHSRFDPLQESIRIVEKEYRPNHLHILYGYGLGYLANTLIDKFNNKEKLIIIDPIYNSLNNNNLESAIQIIDSFDEDLIKKTIENAIDNLNRKIKIICSPNYNKILPSEYLDLLGIVKKIQDENLVMESTIRFLSESWQENYTKNILHISQDTSIKVLHKLYNCPVVLASAGPSLIKQLMYLEKIQEKVIIIAAGSTISSLISRGITPDFIMSIDGHINSYSIFKDLGNLQSNLVYVPSSYYKIQESFKGQRYFLGSSNDVEYNNNLTKMINLELIPLPAGASVAHYGLTFASYISTGPIAIIGQDLAFTNNQSHADNNLRLRKLDKEAEDLFEVEGYYNDKVLTNRVFSSMILQFEGMLKALEFENEIFNCTEGGAKIKNLNQMAFEDFCTKYVYKRKNEPKIFPKEECDSERIIKLIEVLKYEIKIYSELAKEVNLAVKSLRRNKNMTYFTKSLLRELDKVDKKLKVKLNNLIFKRILEPIIIDVMRSFEPELNETIEQKHIRVYNQNIYLYDSLYEALKISKVYIAETIENCEIYLRKNLF